MAGAVSFANLCSVHGRCENLQPHNMQCHASCDSGNANLLENEYKTCLKVNTSYKAKRNVRHPMSNARKCKDIIIQIINRPKTFWINLNKLAGKRKSRANGCREGEETAFANWLAWYVVRIACVMELNRKFIFVDSSLDFFHFLLEISASSDWNLYLLQRR